MDRGDGFILLLLSIIVIAWLWYLFRRWLTAPLRTRHLIEPDSEVLVTEVVELLEYAGYQVLTGKRKIPISIQVNDDLKLESRLFIDHFATDQQNLYIVKLARDRKPLEWTGSSVRDQLLIYQLLYGEAQGILYVNPKLRTIDKISFAIEA